jgi:DNA-binding XRE family transcriptional regulator
MARSFKELKAKMSPESRARAEAKAQQMIDDMALDELRAARDLTQEHLSTLLGISQAAISKMEHRTDMYVSTLGHFIKAMGGRLEIRAIFPDGDVRITQFEQLTGAVRAEPTKEPKGKVVPRRRLVRQPA